MKEFDGADFLVFSEEENPYYNNPDVLQVIDGSNITASAAVINPNRYDIRYIDAIAEFAATRPDAQREALLAQYGRRPGGATTGPRTFEAATAVLAGVTAAVRAEGERRRRQWAANYKRRFDEAGVDFMLVLTLGGKPALRVEPVLSGAAQQPAGELAELPDGRRSRSATSTACRSAPSSRGRASPSR